MKIIYKIKKCYYKTLNFIDILLFKLKHNKHMNVSDLNVIDQNGNIILHCDNAEVNMK